MGCAGALLPDGKRGYRYPGAGRQRFYRFRRGASPYPGRIFQLQNAGKLYERLVKPDPFSALPKITLPSTSPARAMRFEDKLALWRPLRRFWEEAAGKC